MNDVMIALGISALIAIGLIFMVIRDVVVAKQKFHVKPKLFIGYDKESESNWNKKFGYGHQLLQLPNLKSLYEAFDPSILTLDEAEAETVIKLDYSWGTGKTYGQSGSFYGNIAGISLRCVITVSSREDQKVIMRETMGGKPPPDTITYRPGHAPSEYYGEMPSVESIIYFLKKLRVETLDDIAVSPKVETLIESPKKSLQSDFKGQELNPSSSPNPTTFRICQKCGQMINITQFSCPNCGDVSVDFDVIKGTRAVIIVLFTIALVSYFAFASGDMFWIVLAIIFDAIFGLIGITIILAIYKTLLKKYRPNRSPKSDKESVPSPQNLD